MRPGQNKRMRGRNSNNNNRKGPNPLTRSYESNGPDVKIRGTAHHVGEKYLQLARDAQSSGDPVMAESYLQHAEHYFRLIAAAQQAQQQAQFGYQRQAGDQADTDEDDADEDFASLPDRFASPSEKVVPVPQPVAQPYADRQPFAERQQPPYEPRQDRQAGDRQAGDRQERHDPRQGQPQDRDRSMQGRDRQFDNRRDRGNYQDRNGQDRNGQDRNGQDRQGQDRQPRDFDNRGYRNDRNRDFREGQPRTDARPAQDDPAPNGLPAFITAPVRVPAESDIQPDPADLNAPPPVDAGDDGFHLRPRRRRRAKGEFAGGEDEGRTETPAPDPVSE